MRKADSRFLAAPLRHIFSRHSNEKIEKSRGQIAIKQADFDRIPDVIANPDRLVFGFKTDSGLNGIGYIKKMDDGSVLYLEEVRTGRRTMSAVSMRKFPAAKDTNSIAVLPSYAQSDGGVEIKIIDNPARSKLPRYSMASPERFKPVDEAKSLYDKASKRTSDFLTDMMGRNETWNILKLVICCSEYARARPDRFDCPSVCR